MHTMNYSAKDHAVWGTLYRRHVPLVKQYASNLYKAGFGQLQLSPDQVPSIKEMNLRLRTYTDWQLVPSHNIMPTHDFIAALNNKTFPVALEIREEKNLDFNELPDIFHDVFGHVPMLLNSVFCDFLESFGQIAVKYQSHEELIVFLSRLYWFTLEMGLIHENGEHKPFGAAIMTSLGELKNISSDKVEIKAFDMDEILTTNYDNLKLQKNYFTCQSIEQLNNSLNRADKFIELRLQELKVI